MEDQRDQVDQVSGRLLLRNKHCHGGKTCTYLSELFRPKGGHVSASSPKETHGRSS